MNTTKFIKNFNPRTLEKTLVNLVNINNTTIKVAYFAFDKYTHITAREDYVINGEYLCSHEKSCGSVDKAVNKILTAHPDAKLARVEFSVVRECVEIFFHEDIG